MATWPWQSKPQGLKGSNPHLSCPKCAQHSLSLIMQYPTGASVGIQCSTFGRSSCATYCCLLTSHLAFLSPHLKKKINNIQRLEKLCCVLELENGMPFPLGVALSRCPIEFSVNLLPSGSLRIDNEPELPAFCIGYHEHD